jgi:endoglucanase
MERQQPPSGNPDEEIAAPNTQMAISGAIAIAALVILIIVALIIEPRASDTGAGTGTGIPAPSSDPSSTPSSTPTPVRSPGSLPLPALGSPTSTEIFAGGLYADQLNHAVRAEKDLRAAGDTATADVILEISSKPTAVWLGDQYNEAELRSLLSEYRADANRLGQTLVFVTYAVPGRDCGGFSAGGLERDEYLHWNRVIAEELRGSGAVVLVEPDSLAQLSNNSCNGLEKDRLAVLYEAVTELSEAGLTLYLDGGGSHWVEPDVMAERLWSAGVEKTRGFFTNVSNYYRVDQERAYADDLSALVGGRHYVIDVSRNGNGWQGHWCNPPGAAIGQAPHVSAGTGALDALLWVKHPGDSDGSCNGAPEAGRWWQSNAIELVENHENR